jgi:hypothetical protein
VAERRHARRLTDTSVVIDLDVIEPERLRANSASLQ